MAKLTKWFKRIPWYKDYYSINEEWKIASYQKFCWCKKWWVKQHDPVYFLKPQVWSYYKAKNTVTIQLHKNGKKKNFAIVPLVKELFWIRCFLFPSRNR